VEKERFKTKTLFSNLSRLMQTQPKPRSIQSFCVFFIVISHHYVSFSCRRQFYNNFRALRWKQFPHKLNWI